MRGGGRGRGVKKSGRARGVKKGQEELESQKCIRECIETVSVFSHPDDVM